MLPILDAIRKKYDIGNTHDIKFSDELETKLIREIILAHMSWHRNAAHLLNINSLKLKQLKIESKGDFIVDEYRKPKIELYFKITRKGKLILEWCPAYIEDSEDLDFKRFYEKPIIGSSSTYPTNRLFDIDGFKLFSREVPLSNSNLSEEIANSLLQLYWTIYKTLSIHFTIIKLNQIVLNETETVFILGSKLERIDLLAWDKVEQIPDHNSEYQIQFY